MIAFEWRAGKTSGRENGYLGSQVVVVLKPHEAPYAEELQLDVLLPGCGGERNVHYTDRESARAYFEKVVLADWLKKTGLQIKPPRGKAKPVPPVVKRVERYLEARRHARERNEATGWPNHGAHPYAIDSVTGPDDKSAEINLTDLKLLIELAKKA